jgi:hypothetical protein
MGVRRAGCLVVIAVVLSAACGFRAFAEESGVLSIRPVSRLIQADPGSVVTIVAAIENHSAEVVDVDVSPELPRSWSAFFGDERVRLAPGETDILPISAVIPKNAQSGSYEIPVHARYACPRTGHHQSSTVVFTVAVSEVRSIRVALVNAPDYVVDTTYTVSFLLSNQGNVVEDLRLSVRDIQGVYMKLNPDRICLEPGASVPIDVHVTLNAAPGRVLDHTVFIKAESGDLMSNSASTSARVKVLPQKLSDSDAYHQFPLKIQLSAGALGISDRAHLKVAGAGPLFYEGKDRLRFDLSDTGGIVEYRAPGVRLLLGDGKFSLSPLTEWQAKAQGIGAEIGRGGSGLVLYTHDGAGSPRLGLRAYTASSSGSSLSFQLLTQVEPAMNILTVKGGHKTPGVEIDLEYGMLANGSGSGAQALRASGRAKLGPVEAILAVQNTDRSYTIIDNPGLDISLKLKSVSTGPVSAGLLLQKHDGGELHSRKVQADTRWKLDSTELGLKYSGTAKWDGGSDASGRSREASVFLNVFDSSNSFFKQEISVQNKSSMLGDHESWTLVYALKRQLTESRWKLTSYLSAGMPLGQGASARLGLGAEASYQVAPGLEMRGSFRAGNMGQSGLTMSAGATYKPSDWAAISVDGSCKIVGGGVRDLGVKVCQTAFFDVPLARRSDVGEIAGEVAGVDGQGVQGIIVNVGGLSTVTDSSGTFRFPAVVQGEQYVSVSVRELGPGYLVMPSSAVGVKVEPNAASTVQFTVARSGRIEGIVRFSSGEGSCAEPDEMIWRITEGISAQRAPNLLSGLLVEISGARRYVVPLDSEGRFAIDHLPPGDYRISVDRRAIPSLYEAAPSAMNISLGEGESASVEFLIYQVVREYDFIEGGEIGNELVTEGQLGE